MLSNSNNGESAKKPLTSKPSRDILDPVNYIHAGYSRPAFVMPLSATLHRPNDPSKYDLGNAQDVAFKLLEVDRPKTAITSSSPIPLVIKNHRPKTSYNSTKVAYKDREQEKEEIIEHVAAKKIFEFTSKFLNEEEEGLDLDQQPLNQTQELSALASRPKSVQFKRDIAEYDGHESSGISKKLVDSDHERFMKSVFAIIQDAQQSRPTTSHSLPQIQSSEKTKSVSPSKTPKKKSGSRPESGSNKESSRPSTATSHKTT
jgi:hypothetical protein